MTIHSWQYRTASALSTSSWPVRREFIVDFAGRFNLDPNYLADELDSTLDSFLDGGSYGTP